LAIQKFPISLKLKYCLILLSRKNR